MKVIFASDLHLGHQGISNKFRTNFSSDEEHNNVIFDNLASCMNKRTKLFLGGDVAFTQEWLDKLKSLPGIKVLILGNHDLDRQVKSVVPLVSVYDEIYGLYKYKEFWLSHCPIHPEELRGRFNIHGHVHNKTLDDRRYINISMENIDYKPISLDRIREEVKDVLL